MVPVHQAREKEIETGDREMNRMREGRPVSRGYLERKQKTFLNVILHHVRDDSGFSLRPNIGRYVYDLKKILQFSHFIGSFPHQLQMFPEG